MKSKGLILFLFSIVIVFSITAATKKSTYSPVEYKGDKEFFVAAYALLKGPDFQKSQGAFFENISFWDNSFETSTIFLNIKNVTYRIKMKLTYGNGLINTEIVLYSVLSTTKETELVAKLMAGEKEEGNWYAMSDKYKIETANSFNKYMQEILTNNEKYEDYKNQALSDIIFLSKIIEPMNSLGFKEFKEDYLQSINLNIKCYIENVNDNKKEKPSDYDLLVRLRVKYLLPIVVNGKEIGTNEKDFYILFYTNDKSFVRKNKGAEAVIIGKMQKISRSIDNSLEIVIEDGQ